MSASKKNIMKKMMMRKKMIMIGLKEQVDFIELEREEFSLHLCVLLKCVKCVTNLFFKIKKEGKFLLPYLSLMQIQISFL